MSRSQTGSAPSGLAVEDSALDVVDLRSDTVTRPTARMRRAMAEAEVGDDVYGEDPTVALLEREVAAIAGKEAGLFLPSGTQSNLVALMAHCQRGDEYIVGQVAHTYRYEGGGAAVLGSIQPQPLPLSPRGEFDLEQLRSVIKPDDPHFARTRLIAVENAHNGRVVPPSHIDALVEIAEEHGLGLHLDGARAWNAAVASRRPLADLLGPFRSASLCLSKGLGAPVGSVLVGDAELIRQAHRIRKMVGGGMRQAGVLAAAGRVAVEERERLAEDHRRAARLAEGLADIPGMVVDREAVETNMVFASLAAMRPREVAQKLSAHGVRVSASRPMLRLVVHRDVDDAGIDRAVEAFSSLGSGSR